MLERVSIRAANLWSKKVAWKKIVPASSVKEKIDLNFLRIGICSPNSFIFAQRAVLKLTNSFINNSVEIWKGLLAFTMFLSIVSNFLWFPNNFFFKTKSKSTFKREFLWTKLLMSFSCNWNKPWLILWCQLIPKKNAASRSVSELWLIFVNKFSVWAILNTVE